MSPDRQRDGRSASGSSSARSRSRGVSRREHRDDAWSNVETTQRVAEALCLFTESGLKPEMLEEARKNFESNRANHNVNARQKIWCAHQRMSTPGDNLRALAACDNGGIMTSGVGAGSGIGGFFFGLFGGRGNGFVRGPNPCVFAERTAEDAGNAQHEEDEDEKQQVEQDEIIRAQEEEEVRRNYALKEKERVFMRAIPVGLQERRQKRTALLEAYLHRNDIFFDFQLELLASFEVNFRRFGQKTWLEGGSLFFPPAAAPGGVHPVPLKRTCSSEPAANRPRRGAEAAGEGDEEMRNSRNINDPDPDNSCAPAPAAAPEEQSYTSAKDGRFQLRPVEVHHILDARDNWEKSIADYVKERDGFTEQQRVAQGGGRANARDDEAPCSSGIRHLIARWWRGP
eukprot:g14122.t1